MLIDIKDMYKLFPPKIYQKIPTFGSNPRKFPLWIKKSEYSHFRIKKVNPVEVWRGVGSIIKRCGKYHGEVWEVSRRGVGSIVSNTHTSL